MKEINRITIVDDEFQAFNSLTEKLQRIKDVDFLNKPELLYGINEKHLVSIKISFFGLTSFPPEIASFTKLQQLDLKCNNIEIIPSWIEELKDLQYLNLDSNLIQMLPEKFRSLSKLTILTINQNKFRRIPVMLNNFIQLKTFQLVLNNLDTFYGSSYFVFTEALQSQLVNFISFGKTNWLFPEKIKELMIFLAQNQRQGIKLRDDFELKPIIQEIWQIYQKSINDIIQDYKQGHQFTDIEQERLIIEMTSAEWPELQPLLSPESELYKQIIKHMEIWHFLGYD